MKAWSYYSLCAFALSFAPFWHDCGACQAFLPHETIIEQQSKYIDGSAMEYVTFFSEPCSEGTCIARRGILVKKPDARATILICHGFMCNKFDMGFLRPLLFNRFNVLMFDFRAHGEHIEPHHCCTFGKDEALDVAGAISYIRSRDDLKELPLIAYGFSMGAVAAIQAQAAASCNPQLVAEKKLFDALVLDCPFDSSENVIKRCIQHLKVSLFGYSFNLPGRSILERYAFNPYVQSLLKAVLRTIAHMDATATNTIIYPLSPAESIQKVTAPCFFIHCYNDEKVTVRGALALYDNAHGYKRLWITKGRRHFDSIFFNPDKYIYKVNKFIDDVLSEQINTKKRQKVSSDIQK